jgi:hypothetical protein
VLSGTPTVVGTFPIVVKATDANGCVGTGSTYNLVIGCQTITVTNPATTTGTANAPFSQTFTQMGAIGTATFTTASTLPTGLSLSTAGVLSGTPTQTGTFPIVVTVTDSNGCTGNSTTYNLSIGCQTITVTNPVNTNGTVSAPFSEQFSQTGAIGGATFTTASTLPTGLTLSTAGLLSGTPTQPGTFPIIVTVTDGNSCTGNSPTYTLVIACQTITVTNPVTNTVAAGTPFSVTFTQMGGIGTTNFTTASTLPTGLTLHAATGVLDGTPNQGGTFPIVVTATDSNGCTGNGPTYTLTVTCPTITVTNPGVSTGTAGTAFSQTFTQSGGIGTITWSETGALPTGISINTSTGVLSGTTSQVGTFPITVTATDQNGCQGTGATYNLTFNCQTVTVTNPGVNTGTVDAAFCQTFTATGILGTVTWSETGALPAGITLDSSTGALCGTPTVKGSFPITVKATDTNGCFGTSSYTLTINCQTITVTKPVVTTGTVDAAFSQTFTQSGAHGTATFTTASTLPAGLSLSTAGVLSGTPTVKGTFPIVVTVTDSNGCTGSSSTYSLVIGCQTITVTNPGVTTGTAGTAFGQTFTQTAAHGTATFTTASTLPTGFSLSTAGVLSGTTTQHGTFPIIVTVTDSNGCTGTGATYNLVINCNTITVTNPATTTGTVATAFNQTFSQSGVLGTASFSTASTLPTGLTLHSATGVLDGTPTQSGTFPIVVTATDSNGCTGNGPTYSLVIACNVITVTNPATTTGTAGTFFTATFTQSGGNGTITWSETGALPSGITINTSTGVLSGTTSVTGSFPITVTATDSNGCQGTGATYTLIINCQTVTVTNPAQTSVQAGVALNVTFTATGILGTATWSETGALPSGITLASGTGVLSGTTNSVGSFPITVKALDTNGCFGTSSYTLTVTCPVITVTRNGGGSFPAGTFNVAYTGQSFTASGGSGTYTFAVTAGALPTSLSLSSAGAISGTPTQTGKFAFTVTATDTASNCTGLAAFTITINPAVGNDTYSNLIDNTQAFVSGGTTGTPATPAVSFAGKLTANDTPAGFVTVTAGTVGTTAGGSVTIAADGTFLYTPKANPSGAAITTDSFTYTGNSDTGGTGTPGTATGTVTLNLANRVWYVKNNGAAGDGRSHLPFNTLAAAQTASTAGDIIFVYNGNGTTSGQTAGITLKANQLLIGEGVALVVNGNTLVAAGTKPQITNTAATSDGITLAAGNTVEGLTVTGATRDGISGTSVAGFTGDSLTISNNTASGIDLITMTGTVTLTNSSVSGNATGLTVNGGTEVVTADATNTFTSSGSGKTVSIGSHATGAITIGATLNDSGAGILVQNNTSGTINFSGSQTLTTTANQAVTLSTNTGATIDFSGTLNITTTTGIGFGATGGGTVNVTGTANLTTGAAANGLNINGVTVGTGITFASVNTTGATTGVTVSPLTGSGTVTINGGTISGGTTGILLGISFAKLSLANVTVTGATVGISATPAFNTLTIGSSVNVSSATALSLTTGTVSGTFANVTSTGGVDGISLNTIAGTWGATTGSLSGATGSTLLISGGTETFSYGGSISGGLLTVNISGATGGTITLSGAIGSSRILLNSNSGATINFTGVLTLSTGVNPAFTATNGGTVSSTAATSTLTTTSGIALNVANTTIGASGLTFKSISSNGASSGIVLNTTGAGSLTVTGDGASDPANTTRGNTTARNGGGTITLGSGGTISGATSSGISLTSTGAVSLTSMNINSPSGQSVNSGANGITASTVGGLTLDNVLINGFTGNSGLRGTSISNLSMQHTDIDGNGTTVGTETNNNWNVRLDELAGNCGSTCNWENSLFFNSRENIVGITQGVTNLTVSTTMTITNCEFRDTTTFASPANDAFLVSTHANAVTNITATGSTFKNVEVCGFQYTGNDNDSGTVNVRNSIFENTGSDIIIAHGGGSGGNSALSFDTSGNTTRQLTGNPLSTVAFDYFLAGLSGASSSMTGTVKNNAIGNSGVTGSGSHVGDGMDANATGSGTLTMTLGTGPSGPSGSNTIHQIKNGDAFFGEANSGSAKLNIFMHSDSFNTDNATATAGAHLVGSAMTSDSSTLCVDMSANTLNGPGYSGVELDNFGTTAMIKLVGMPAADNDAPASIATFINGANTTVSPAASAGFVVISGGHIISGTCGVSFP